MLLKRAASAATDASAITTFHYLVRRAELQQVVFVSLGFADKTRSLALYKLGMASLGESVSQSEHELAATGKLAYGMSIHLAGCYLFHPPSASWQLCDSLTGTCVIRN